MLAHHEAVTGDPNLLVLAAILFAVLAVTRLIWR